MNDLDQPFHLTLRQLQVFVCVAEMGGVTAASVRLAMSQSAASAALHDLEAVVGQPLFEREGRGLKLNARGRLMLARSRVVLAAAREAQAVVANEGDLLQSLTIGASTTVGNHVLPAVLGALWGDQPYAGAAWNARIHIGNTAEICQGVVDHRYDVGLIEGTCHEGVLEVFPWIRDDFVIVASPLSPWNRPLAALTDLAQAVWLVREAGSGTRETMDRALAPILHGMPRCVEMNSSEAMAAAAVAGLGVACLSRWVVRSQLKSGDLCELNVPDWKVHRQCYWVTRRDRPDPTVRDLLKSTFDAFARVDE